MTELNTTTVTSRNGPGETTSRLDEKRQGDGTKSRFDDVLASTAQRSANSSPPDKASPDASQKNNTNSPTEPNRGSLSQRGQETIDKPSPEGDDSSRVSGDDVGPGAETAEEERASQLVEQNEATDEASETVQGEVDEHVNQHHSLEDTEDQRGPVATSDPATSHPVIMGGSGDLEEKGSDRRYTVTASARLDTNTEIDSPSIAQTLAGEGARHAGEIRPLREQLPTTPMGVEETNYLTNRPIGTEWNTVFSASAADTTTAVIESVEMHASLSSHVSNVEIPRRESALGTVGTIPLPAVDLASGSNHRGIAEGIIWMVKNGLTEAFLAVKPPDLSPINISISLREEDISVKLNVADVATREVIESTVGKLREAMAANGLTLNEVDVENRDGDMQDFRRHEDLSSNSEPHDGSDDDSNEQNHEDSEKVWSVSSATAVDYYV